MLILSHRGYWQQSEEKNAPIAFDRTVALGFGTETDVRDHDGTLVVSHDPATGSSLPWTEVLERFDGSGLKLAVNIKADGLSPLLEPAMAVYDIDWFAFDMSGPETIRFARAELPYFTRHSDYEPHPICYDGAKGVWLDAFDGPWFDRVVITTHLAAGKQVCIVSSDLHGRPTEPLWQNLRDWNLHGDDRLLLCTDFPEQAQSFFS